MADRESIYPANRVMRFFSALNVFDDSRKGMTSRVLGLYTWLIACNLVAWAWAFALFHDKPLLLSTAVLAYTFGLRHAFDIDHIAAIDNVTCKLMQDGRRPIAVGLFFSLGHSTVVVALVVAVAFATIALQHHFDAFKNIGAVIGTSVSSIFLLIIGIANLLVLTDVYRLFQSVKNGGRLDEQALATLNARRGFLGRILHPVLAMVRRGWHMYPIGFLFGLGFDTATEVGLLGISAAHASEGLSVWSILVFPALFTAGMSLADTTDSVVMTGAYGWAFVRPLRKLWYNLAITAASVFVALFIGSVEALGLIRVKFVLTGGVWPFIEHLNDSLANFGFVAVALFLMVWLVCMAIYRAKGYDDLRLES